VETRILVIIISFFCLFSIIHASNLAFQDQDIKKIVANSSIAHMSFALLGLLTFTREGIFGALYLILGHGIVSALAFFCLGLIYDRKHTRLLYYMTGSQKHF